MATMTQPPTKSTRRMSHAELIEAAGYYGIDPAGFDCEALRSEIRKVASARFLEENRAAMDEWNAWVRENGIPCADLNVI